MGVRLGKVFSPFVRTGNAILIMDIASAETKYAANAMRISFMNAMAGRARVRRLWDVAFLRDHQNGRVL